MLQSMGSQRLGHDLATEVNSGNSVAQEVGLASSRYVAANHLRSTVHRQHREVVKSKNSKARLLLFTCWFCPQ